MSDCKLAQSTAINSIHLYERGSGRLELLFEVDIVKLNSEKITMVYAHKKNTSFKNAIKHYFLLNDKKIISYNGKHYIAETILVNNEVLFDFRLILKANSNPVLFETDFINL